MTRCWGQGGRRSLPDPTGFGCDGFMPTTLIWHDPYFGDQSMTYNPNTGQYESDPDTFDYDSCCGCDAASNVPVQWTYSTTGVTMKYKGDGGGCPTSGSPGDNLNQNVPFNNNGISFCTTDPGEFGTNPMDPVNDDSGPGCIIYSCTPDPFGTLDTPVSGVSPCTYIPRTLYFKESQFEVWTLRYDGDEGGWFGEKPVTIPGVGPCLTATVIVKVAYYLNKFWVVFQDSPPLGWTRALILVVSTCSSPRIGEESSLAIPSCSTAHGILAKTMGRGPARPTLQRVG